MSKNYVVLHAKAKCDKGCISNCLNVGTDHGVYKTIEDGSKYPVLNSMDNLVKVNISQFGVCSITGQSCVPQIMTPWFDANEANVLENGACITESSKLACAQGGIISIDVEK